MPRILTRAQAAEKKARYKNGASPAPAVAAAPQMAGWEFTILRDAAGKMEKIIARPLPPDGKS